MLVKEKNLDMELIRATWLPILEERSDHPDSISNDVSDSSDDVTNDLCEELDSNKLDEKEDTPKIGSRAIIINDDESDEIVEILNIFPVDTEYEESEAMVKVKVISDGTIDSYPANVLKMIN